jgi:HAE1 family hydrophobic/amphiphilic exporter-1
MLRVESTEATPNETFFHKIYRISEYGLSGIENAYRRLLHFALRHRILVVTVSCLLLASAVPIYQVLSFEYMPETDEGQVRVYARMAPGTRLEALDDAFTKLEKIIDDTIGDETEHVSTRFGMTSWYRAGGSNTGSIEIQLKDVSERTRSSQEIADDLRQKITGIPGVRAYARAGGGLFIFRMLQPEGERLAVEVRGYDKDEAFKVAEQVRDKLEKIEGISDAQLSRSEGRPELGLQIDRYKAAEAGFTVSSLAEAIRTNFGGEVATRYREGGDEFDVRVRLKEEDRQKVQDLRTAWVTTPSGDRVPVSNFLKEERTIGPTQITRKNQERQLTVAADLEEGYALGNVMKDVAVAMRSIQLPQDFTLVYGGEYEEQQKSYAQLNMGMILAIVLVYMVMAAQFESFIQPFVIMFAIPFASIGVLLMLWLTNTSVNVQSFLGMIVLIGIVVNNAIVLVDYTNLLRRERAMELHEAVEEGGRRRLRPILMTTLTTTLALVPLALGLGDGGELQAPMARVVIGGMLTSTLITLVLIPVLYTTLEEFLARYRKVAHEPSINEPQVAK